MIPDPIALELSRHTRWTYRGLQDLLRKMAILGVQADDAARFIIYCASHSLNPRATLDALCGTGPIPTDLIASLPDNDDRAHWKAIAP